MYCSDPSACYWTTTDSFNEYLHVGESTGKLCLMNFCKGVRAAFTDEFLKKPSTADCQFLLQLHEQVHGFPGMLGSVDCMHWQWKNCHVAWRGSYTSGHKGTHPTFILEVVADYRLWIWHAYFRVPGSNTDVNVLNNSNLFSEVLNGKASAINFIANNRQYKMGQFSSSKIQHQHLQVEESVKRDFDAFFSSKRRVPNESDPLHNR
ncbi:uncharacterized protein LOC125220844 [Salvia hispanica]|uniref:uncharacterized protein LOC125220844 n=1 Tax=Salvia hispanica TaxID=49212 RepID=UPI002009D2C5|nr:uncharacterized protein LOC125220844 [Salvia hispanica]